MLPSFRVLGARFSTPPKLIGTVVITMYENGISSTLINLNLAYNLLAKLIADEVDVPYEFKHKYREYYDNTVYQKIGP